MNTYTVEEITKACHKAFVEDIEQGTETFIKVCLHYSNQKNKWAKQLVSEDHIILAAYKSLATYEITNLFNILNIDCKSKENIYVVIKNMSETEMSHFISKIYAQGLLDGEFNKIDPNLKDGTFIMEPPENLYKEWDGLLMRGINREVYC